MNLFWLSKKFKRNARYHCDQHVGKMALESAQILYTALAVRSPNTAWRESAPWNKSGTARGYRATHLNHPLSIWVRTSLANYLHCAQYALALCAEYTKRFRKTHFVEHHVQWLIKHHPTKFEQVGMTLIPLCIGSDKTQYASSKSSAIRAYRKYYCDTKSSFALYRHCKAPKWLTKI